MSSLRNIATGLRSLFRRKKVSRELDEELAAYLEMAAAEKMKQGMSRMEALRAVRLERGHLEGSKEIVRSGGWESGLETCWRDLRFGVRTLRKSPGFTAVGVLTLALGIGANTVIFSAVYAVLLKPLPFKDSDRLVFIEKKNPPRGWTRNPISPAEILAWRDQSGAFDVNGDSYTVVGVMASNFSHLYASPFGALPELWLSGIGLSPTLVWNDYFGIGRLKPGVSLQQAEAQMNTVSERIEPMHNDLKGWRAQLMTLRTNASGDTRAALFVLMGAVIFVLLIACANIANLLLARGSGRANEFA